MAPRVYLSASFCLLLACASSCARGAKSTAERASEREVAVFITSDLRGYLGPCGCSENMQGGIQRAAFEVDQPRKAGVPTAVFDSGDALFRYLQPTDLQKAGEARKAKAIAEALNQMGVAAKAVGERDLVDGRSFLEGLGLPLLDPGATKTVTVGGHLLGVLAAQTPEQLAAGAKKLEGEGAEFTVGLLHVDQKTAQRFAAAEGVSADLLVASHAEGELAGEENRLIAGRVPLAVLQSKGRSVLRVDLTFGGAGRFELFKGQADQERELASLSERIELLRAQVNEPSLNPELLKLRKAKLEELLSRREAMAAKKPTLPEGRNVFTVRFIPLESTVPDEPKVAQILSRYDEDVGQLNVAYAKTHNPSCPEAAKGQPVYVGSEACRDCHEESFAVWEASKHAHAYATLESKHKQFHLDCIGCHVVGYQKPGGVCRIDQVKARAEVGCESCHGPGSVHVDEPDDDNIRLGNDERTCVGCHDPENSPHFDFEQYLPKILGKGHEGHARK